MKKENWIKRWFLTWAERDTSGILGAGMALTIGMVLWSVALGLTVVTMTPPIPLAYVLYYPLASVAIFGIASGVLHWAVARTFITTISVFPGADCLVVRHDDKTYSWGNAVWAKSYVSSYKLPDTTMNKFGFREFDVNVDSWGYRFHLKVMIRELLDADDPLRGYLASELYKIGGSAEVTNVAEWLGRKFKYALESHPSVSAAIALVDRDEIAKFYTEREVWKLISFAPEALGLSNIAVINLEEVGKYVGHSY